MVGMPETLLLNDFGAIVLDAFGTMPFLVGSSLDKKTGWRDVDIRLILDDEEYIKLGLGDGTFPHLNAKWVALVKAFSALGRNMTGLPIDFQIQQRTYANKTYTGSRSAIGISPHRLNKYKKEKYKESANLVYS